MAKIHASGFDKTTTLLDEFTSFIEASHFDIGAYGRVGGNGLRWDGAGGLASPRADRALGASYGTVFQQFGFKVQAAPDSNGRGICGFLDAGTMQAEIQMDVDGTCHLTGTTSTFTIPLGAYIHFAVKCVLHASAGAWIVQVNGAEVLNVSGIDTTTTANNYATQVSLAGGINRTGTFYYDDWIVYDTSGTTYNDFLGDKRVIEQAPTGDGGTMQFTPSTGTSGFAMVDEVPPDGDTSYIEDATVGHVARLTFPSLPVSTGTVLSADVVWYGRKTDAGTRTIKGSVKSGASTASGADTALATTYGYGRGQFDTDPNGGGAWTIAAVNAAEYGVEVVA